MLQRTCLHAPAFPSGQRARPLEIGVNFKLNYEMDFMFQLTETEWLNLKSQNATSSWGGRRKVPFAFTEYGVLMLSSVLNSDRAIQVNIQIMRIYAKLREMLLTNKDILLKLERLERKALKHDQDIKVVFGYLKELLTPKSEPMRKIGFKRKGEN